MYRIMTIALLLGLSGAVAAKPEKVAVQMDRQGSVAEQVRQVETALAAPDYAELSAEDRGQVQQSLLRIRQHMGERQTVQELPPQLQAEVFNEQERINTLLAPDRRERQGADQRPAQLQHAQPTARRALTALPFGPPSVRSWRIGGTAGSMFHSWKNLEVTMQRMIPVALMLGLALATTAHARPEKAQVKFDANAPVAEQIRSVEAAINSEDYSEIGLEDKSRVQQALGRIKIKMGDHERIEQVSPQDRTQIFNDQEVINTIMTRAHADSRMVCRRERTTGSNMPQSVSLTVAQRRKAQEDSRKALNDNQRFNNYKP